MLPTASVKRLRIFLIAAAIACAAPLLARAQANPPEREWEYSGMGPGMMGGYSYGMGPGMMGGDGYGMGPDMMGGGYRFGRELGLTNDQVAKINQIRDEIRRMHWSLMGAMMDEHAKLRDLYAAPKRDNAAIDDAYKTLGKLQRQMVESSLDARKRMDAVLTKEQREKLRSYGRSGS